MPYRYCSQTHAGLVRENNEDALFVQEALGLVILADGMGGYKAGEVASNMAVNAIAQDLGDWLSQAPADASDKSVRRAIEVSVEKATKFAEDPEFTVIKYLTPINCANFSSNKALKRPVVNQPSRDASTIIFNSDESINFPAGGIIVSPGLKVVLPY